LALICLTLAIFNQNIHLAAQEAGNQGEVVFPSGNDVAPQAGGTGAPDESAFILGEAEQGISPPPVSSGFVVFRTVLTLALAAAAVYGVVFFIRRSFRPRERRNSYLKVLTSAHLGSNRFVHVVNLGNQAWLVGSGEGGVSCIAEVEDRETLDALLLEDSQRQAESGKRIPDFRTLFHRFGGGGGPEDDVSRGSGYSADSVRKNRERLRGL
jgi:flagellar protein FliO/FliZ